MRGAKEWREGPFLVNDHDFRANWGSAMTENVENASVDPEFLTDRQMDIVFFIERYHALQGEVPSSDVIHRRFELFDGELTAFQKHPLVVKSMKYRGITFPAAEDVLSAEQMTAIATMLDYTDRRSDEKKLRDVGITTRQWTTWMLDDTFSEYLRDRSERMLINSQHEAHKGLLKGVRNGNVASVKYMNELTGRYNPEADNAVNIRALLQTMIEILQRYIKDPITLHGIATEMMNAASIQGGNNAAMPAQITGRSAPVVITQLKDDV